MAVTIIACVCTVLGGAASVSAIAIAIGKPLVNNTKIMSELSVNVKNLAEQMKAFELGNSAAHKRLHDRIDKAEDEIKEQGMKIAKLEGRKV